MNSQAFAIMLAAFFTFGCITIHESRQYARKMTPMLVLIVMCLGVFVGLVTLAERPGEVRSGNSQSAAMHK